MQPNNANQTGQIPSPNPGQPTYQGPAPAGQQPSQDYSFIMNPAEPAKPKIPLPGLSGPTKPITRVAVVLGGLLIVMILFVLAKSLITGGGNNPVAAYTAVVQQQQALIHISGNAGQQQNTSTATQNSVATISLSVTSAKNQLAAYMAQNHMKVSNKQINLKVSSTIDTQLTAAAAAGTYDQTYKTVMQTALADYEQSLKTAYNQTQGPKGKALLSSEYDSADQLIKQLGPN